MPLSRGRTPLLLKKKTEQTPLSPPGPPFSLGPRFLLFPDWYYTHHTLVWSEGVSHHHDGVVIHPSTMVWRGVRRMSGRGMRRSTATSSRSRSQGRRWTWLRCLSGFCCWRMLCSDALGR